jgi:hypothetical protein
VAVLNAQLDAIDGKPNLAAARGLIEDWHGVPDPKYRGTGGPVFVEPAPNPERVSAGTSKGAEQDAAQ